MKRCSQPILTLIAAAVCTPLATAQDDAMLARLIGALDLTIVKSNLEGVPAREAIKLVSTAIDTTIIGRWDNDGRAHGLPADMPVHVVTEQAPARFVLEMILEQIALEEPATWQLRNGFIEVGTKHRLGAAPAARVKLYPLDTLLVEPPVFGSNLAGIPTLEGFDKHPYRSAALGRPAEPRQYGIGGTIGGISGGGGFTSRKTSEEILPEIVRGIVEMIEPGNWDFGETIQIIDDGDGNRERTLRYDPTKMARLRVHENGLVIVAPDFIHRQVGGYPRARSPAALTHAQLAARHEAATTEQGSVLVVEITRRVSKETSR